MSDRFRSAAAERRRGLLTFGGVAGVTALIIALAAATPDPVPPGPPPAAVFAFAREPDVRVKIRSIEPGGSVRLRGVADGDVVRDVTIKNEAGLLRVDGEPAETPRQFEAPPERTIAVEELRYRGELVVAAEPGRPNLLLINRLPMERYLEGVVLSEMSAKFPEEALRSQAVASRSYAAYKVQAMRSRPFDVSDTQMSQVYKGALDRGRSLAARLVSETRGLVLVHEDRVLEAVFSSTCGGTTRSAEEAFGASAPAPLDGVPCGKCEGTEFATWRCKVKRATLGKALGLSGPVIAIEDERRLPSDRLAGVTFKAARGSKRLSGGELRQILGDKALSTWFTNLAIDGDSFTAEGRGYGHGAGLCQVGARTLANAGGSWREILTYYYPGAGVAYLYPPSG